MQSTSRATQGTSLALRAELRVHENRVCAASVSIGADPFGPTPAEEIIRLDLNLNGETSACLNLAREISELLHKGIVVGRQPIAVNAPAAESLVVTTRNPQKTNGDGDHE